MTQSEAACSGSMTGHSFDLLSYLNYIKDNDLNTSFSEIIEFNFCLNDG